LTDTPAFDREPDHQAHIGMAEIVTEGVDAVVAWVDERGGLGHRLAHGKTIGPVRPRARDDVGGLVGVGAYILACVSGHIAGDRDLGDLGRVLGRRGSRVVAASWHDGERRRSRAQGPNGAHAEGSGFAQFGF